MIQVYQLHIHTIISTCILIVSVCIFSRILLLFELVVNGVTIERQSTKIDYDKQNQFNETSIANQMILHKFMSLDQNNNVDSSFCLLLCEYVSIEWFIQTNKLYQIIVQNCIQYIVHLVSRGVSLYQQAGCVYKYAKKKNNSKPKKLKRINAHGFFSFLLTILC